MKLGFHRVELPLEHVFTVARGSRTTQSSLIVELQHEGECGYGEATEHAYYGVACDAMVASLERCRETLESYDGQSPSDLWQTLSPSLSNEMFLLAAVDSAAHDLYGKLNRRRTYETLDLRWENVPASSFTIGIDSPDKMVAKMKERSDWPIFKIKLGTRHDLELVRELREHTSARFRVDANCGWTVEETIQISMALRELGVEFIEQPLPANATDDDQRQVFEGSALPIVADESCLTEADVVRCQGKFHGINVKLSKCGGITPAARMLNDARKLGLKTMVGCMVETSVGISAAAQLLPLLDYADLDGAELLDGDAASGVRVCAGVAVLPNEFGNGVRLLESVAEVASR